jgi:hypothetical protein
LHVMVAVRSWIVGARKGDLYPFVYVHTGHNSRITDLVDDTYNHYPLSIPLLPPCINGVGVHMHRRTAECDSSRA